MIHTETYAELAAQYAARKAELHRQLDLIAARYRPNLAVNPMAIVTIPPALRGAGSIDREAVYRFELADGRIALVTGAELARVADDLVRLRGALQWAGEPTIRRFLRGP